MIKTFWCLLIMYETISACNYDRDCPKGQYCYDELACADCVNCTEYFRNFGNIDCPKDPNECGECISGKKEPSKYFGKDRAKYCIDDDKFVAVIKKNETNNLISNEDSGYQTVYIVLLAISVVIVILLLLLCYFFRKRLNRPFKCIKTYCFKAKSKPARERPPTYTPSIINCEDSTLLPSAPPSYNNSLDYITGQQIKKEDERRIFAGVFKTPNYVGPPTQGYGIPGVDDPPNEGNDNDEYDDETRQSTWGPTVSPSEGEMLTSFQNILDDPQGNTSTFREENNTFPSSHGEEESATFNSSESTVYENEQSGLQNHNVNTMNIDQTETNGNTYNSTQSNQNIIVNHNVIFSVNVTT